MLESQTYGLSGVRADNDLVLWPFDLMKICAMVYAMSECFEGLNM